MACFKITGFFDDYEKEDYYDGGYTNDDEILEIDEDVLDLIITSETNHTFSKRGWC